MRQYLLDLYEIQKIDLLIRDQEKRQEALPAHLHDLDGVIDSLRSQLDSLTEQRDNAIKEAQALRHTVEDETQKIRKWEARLNEIRNQREYQALLRETEGSKRANRDAEEKVGTLNTQRDELEKQIADVQGKLAEKEDARTAEQRTVAKSTKALKDELAQEQARRDALVPKVPKPVFRKYDAIRARRLGVGLSPVVAGNCTGCNMRLPPQLYNILQRGDTIEQCPSCHRLIFWDQILPPESDASGPETHVAN